MSSFSSNLCDCVECQYREAYPYEAYGPCPFYPTMGQPYVYYAQVPQGPYTDRRKNPNCFVRAFRWYTQEHIQPTHQQRTDTSTAAADPDVVGFANWLDTKYEQYLREGHSRDARQVVTQTSEGMGVNAQTQSQPGGVKKFTSPWRKRGYYTNTSEGGDVHMDANTSVVYLLEPKDLPRPISECCQVSSTPCCSAATVVKKPACSRSATNTCTRSDVEHIDPVFVQEGIPPNPQQASEPERKQSYRTKEDSKKILQNDPSTVEKHKSRSKSRIRNLFKSNKTENISCACATLPPRPSVDAEAQYDTMIKYACECTSRPRVSENIPTVANPNALSTAPMPTVSVSATPVPAAPMSTVRMSATPVPAVPMSTVRVSATPVPDAPMSTVRVSATPVPAATMSTVRMSATPVPAAPMSTVRMSANPVPAAPMSTVRVSATPVPDAPMSTVRMSSIPMPTAPMPTTASDPPVRFSNAPAPSVPISTASVAHVESKPKQTWSQRGVLKVPKIFRQRDAECQCEPKPKVDKDQYCTQCGCHCAEMHEKMLCCDCAKISCVKEAPALAPPMKQYAAPPPPPPSTEQWYIPEIPPAMPVPPPSPLQTPPVPLATEPHMQIIPPPAPQTPISEYPAPANSEPYASSGRMLAGDSFPCMTCNSAQTSDHAINLDQGIRGYPLFLKIVCADRLNDTCLCRQ